MRRRRRPTYARIARRLGAVSAEDLARAERVRRATGASLEAVLVAHGVLTPELAGFVRAAWKGARQDHDHAA